VKQNEALTAAHAITVVESGKGAEESTMAHFRNSGGIISESRQKKSMGGGTQRRQQHGSWQGQKRPVIGTRLIMNFRNLRREDRIKVGDKGWV